MCTHTRTAPSSSTSAEIASSKSRAVGGSIVNVGSARRSSRAGSASRGRSAAARASRSTCGSKRRRSPRSSSIASITSRATSGRPIRRRILPWPAARPGRATRARGRRRGREPARGRRRSCAGRGRRTAPRSRKRPAPLEHRHDGPSGRSRSRRSRCASRPATLARRRRRSASSGLVLGSSGRLDVGRDAVALLDAAAADVAPAGQEVLADGDVERAAVGELLDLLEDALAERARADHRRALAVLQRAGDDLRRRRRLAVDEHDDRDLRRRSRRRWRRRRAPGGSGPWSRRSCPRG